LLLGVDVAEDGVELVDDGDDGEGEPKLKVYEEDDEGGGDVANVEELYVV